MPDQPGIAEIPSGEPLQAAAFFQEFVLPGKPVLVRGSIRAWNAISRWNPAFFSTVAGRLEVPVKVGNIALGRSDRLRLETYVEQLNEYESALSRNEVAPGSLPYLHDVPIFHRIPQLAADVVPFPTEYFPRWYHRDILRYAQFFMSGTGSRTPLHFDTLCTQNLFFQIYGRKRFILIPASQKEYCYMQGWRWSAVNAADPDYDRHPLYRNSTPTVVDVEAGDMLYIPSGTLHEVVTLSPSISFNIDWHTPRTAVRGILSGFRGAPRENVYYNSLIALGVCLHVPADWLFRYYRSYLSYIS
jgi:hypothetical protein